MPRSTTGASRLLSGVCGLWAAIAVLGPSSARSQTTLSAAPTVPERVLVMPFENVGHDGRIVWVSEGAAIGLTDALQAAGLNPITREERQEAFGRLQVPPAAALTDATVLRLGQLVRATSVILGTVRMDGEALVVEARDIVVDSARVRHRASARGPLAELFATLGEIARQVAPPGAVSARALAPATAAPHPPIAAFESYVKGLLAENPTTAVNHLQASLAVHPTYDRARVALWDPLTKQGDHKSALTALEIVASPSPEFPRARFLLGLSLIEVQRLDEAYLVYQSLAERAPTPAVFNNLGVIQLRRAMSSGPTDTPAAYFKRAADLDAADSDFFFNLGYAYWGIRDSGSAVHWLREAVRRNPADGEAHFVLGASLAAAGNTLEANREKELAFRLSSVFAEWDKRSVAEAVPTGLERVKDNSALPAARSADLLQAAGRDQEELAAFHVARGRRLYEQEKDRDATTELNRALFLSPYHAEGNLLLGRVHQRSGRLAEAIGSYKIALWSAETAAAHAALASAYLDAKDQESARTEAARAIEMDPRSAEARSVLERVARADR